MNKPKHTPGPWKVGKNGCCVISNTNESLTLKGAYEEYAPANYGGYLICESITGLNADLVSTAPEMLNMLKVIAAKDDFWRKIIHPIIMKAEGFYTKTEFSNLISKEMDVHAKIESFKKEFGVGG